MSARNVYKIRAKLGLRPPQLPIADGDALSVSHGNSVCTDVSRAAEQGMSARVPDAAQCAEARRCGPLVHHHGVTAQANNASARTKTIAPSQRAGSWAGRYDKGTVADLIAFANAGAVTLHYRSTKRRLHYA